jgi:hypothetical protein
MIDYSRLKTSFQGSVMPENKLYALFSFLSAIYFFLALLPFVFVPLIGDDFGSFFDPNILDISSESLVTQTKLIVELNSESMHINFLGQLISLLFIKFSLFLNGLGVADLNQMFYLAKFWAYTLFTLSIAYALSIFGKIRFKYSLTLVFLLMPIFLQVRAGWSNDPLSSTPFAGLLSVSFGLFALALFVSRFTKLEGKIVLLFSFLNVIGILLYELNIVVLMIELTLLTPLIFRKKLPKQNSAIAMFLSNLIVLSMFVFIMLFKTLRVSNTYTGTQFETVNSIQQVKVVISAFVSVLPFLSWGKSLDLLAPSMAQMTLIFALLITLGFTLYNVIQIVGTPNFSPPKIDFRKLILPLIIFWAVPTITQSLTSKFQTESRGSFSVYIFVTYSLASITILFSICFLRLISLKGGKGILLGILISISLFQFVLNAGLSKSIHQSYRENIGIIKSLGTESTKETRCDLLTDWLARDWPIYYRENLLISIDRYSIQKNGEPYCSKSTDNRIIP